MKKTFFAIFVLLPLLLSAQVVDYDHVVWDLKNKDGYNIEYNSSEISISDENLTFSITPKAYTPMWSCNIYNHGVDKVLIKWNEAAMGSYITSRMLFGDMRQFEINREIPSATLYKNGSLSKQIIGEDYAKYGNDMVRLKDLKKSFKKTKEPQNTSVTIIIPIEINNETKLYQFELSGTYAGKIKKK